jgi:uncharacterized peroxidase-related enzyme
MPFFKFLPPDATVRHVMTNQPERYLPIGGTFTQNVLRGPSPFTVAERELIAAYVSGLNQCQYCHGAHKAFAVDNGIDPALFESLMADVDAALVADKMKPVLRYVKKLTLTPSCMSQADADAVFAAGWDERALGDAVAICALFNFFNRIVEGHGVRGSDAIWARATRMIRETGYETFLKQAAAERAAARAGE